MTIYEYTRVHIIKTLRKSKFAFRVSILIFLLIFYQNLDKVREMQNYSKVFKSNFYYYQRVAHKKLSKKNVLLDFPISLFPDGGPFQGLLYYSRFSLVELTIINYLWNVKSKPNSVKRFEFSIKFGIVLEFGFGVCSTTLWKAKSSEN